MGYVLVKKDSQPVLEEVTICQYGIVSRTCAECRFVRNAIGQCFGCGECQGLGPSSEDRGARPTGTATGSAVSLM